MTDAIESARLIIDELGNNPPHNFSLCRRPDAAAHALNVCKTFLSLSAEVQTLREALETIATECSPDFLPFANPEEGRENIYKVAHAALDDLIDV